MSDLFKIGAIVIFSIALVVSLIVGLFLVAKYVANSNMHIWQDLAQAWLDTAPPLIFAGFATGLGISLVLVPVLAVVIFLIRD